MDTILLLFTGAAGAAVIKLLDGVLQFYLQRRAKKQDAGDERKFDEQRQLDAVNAKLDKMQESLDRHIRLDDERNADSHRTRILQFNNELLRDIPHTQEDFIEILAEIDFYEDYCKTHPEYKNHRCVHAIANIGRVYDERLRKHDFLRVFPDKEPAN